MTDIFSMIPGIAAVVLVFGGLIFFHELGHFLVARAFNMGVQTFSLGFGKPIFKKRSGKTTYQIAALPLGGFVALVGESPDAELPEGFTKEDSFSLRPAWQRLLVIAAGAIFNLILAVIICWGMALSDGRTEMLPEVGSVMQGTPAMRAGVLPGDTITSIAGEPVNVWGDIPRIIASKAVKGWTEDARKGIAPQDGDLVITLVRKGETKEISVIPSLIDTKNLLGEPVTSWVIGVTASGATRNVDLGFFESFGEGLNKAENMISLTWRVLVGLIKGSVPADNLSGPIGITKIIYDESDKGFSHILFIAAFISVNLGVLNLLPVPILDGGHILFILLEMIFRRPVPVMIREKASMAGLALLLGLMLFATYNDIFRLAGKTDTPQESASATTPETATPSGTANATIAP